MSPYRDSGKEGQAKLALLFFGVSIAIVVAGLYLNASQSGSSSADPLGSSQSLLLFLSLTGLNIITYLVWPSRWNIYAHTQLAFSIIAYAIPIFFLHILNQLPPQYLGRYFEFVTVGFLVAAVGTLFGGSVGRLWNPERLAIRAAFDRPEVVAKVVDRLYSVTWASVIGIVASFLIMGFAPALTADPQEAKFFRGPYAAAYAPVAPVYRAATTLLSLLFPVLVILAWEYRRSIRWKVALLGGFGVLVLGLQRQPTFIGFLLALGVIIALKKKYLLLYFGILIAAYFVGASLYYILGYVGFSAFAANNASGGSFLAQVASGSPDVSDQVHFLLAWFSRPEYTHGLTFVGGLIPGNFRWNAGVWSLQVLNPGQAIKNIASGGLRLPAPIWGFVSFGWPGLIGVYF
jgi:hypothetical protein